MLDRYDAFLSYSHRYKGWVEILHRNLERCLKAAGQPGMVFLDKEDLVSGRSWITQLQQGLDRSEQVILVVTPEALASERMADEWDSLITAYPDWRNGRLHLAVLVDAPLPRFFKSLQCVDFQESGEAQYRQALRTLLGGLLGLGGRSLPELSDNLEIPPPVAFGLPPALRARIVAWLASVFEKPFLRVAAASSLGISTARLESQPSWECAASAALVWSTGSEAPVLAAQRIVSSLLKGFEGYDVEALAALARLQADLAHIQAARPETGLLDHWLRQIATDHETLVPFQEKAKLELLDRVFVQLDLRPDLRPSLEAKEEALLDRSLSLQDLLYLRREDHCWATGRWVVLGDPGSGKTTLLRHLTRTLALDGARRWVPLYDSLPRLLRDRYSLFARAVRRMEKVSGKSAKGLEGALGSAGEEGRLLFLLDGLDEVSRESREEAEELLRGFSLQWPQTPIVVTSRPIGYRRPGNEFREVDLLPLDRDRKRALLANWFGRATGHADKARADRALLTLDAPELRELAGNPLYLTLMALLFEQNKVPDRHRTGLYDQVFDLLLAGRHREGAQPIERKNLVREVLRALAYGMTEDNRDAEPVEKLDDRLYRPEMERLRKKLEQVARWRQSTRTFLDELADKSGILGAHDGLDAEWRFWHRTFREALTAERLAEEYWEGGRALIINRARKITAENDLSRWAEPFALLAGWVTDPDNLVRSLFEANRPLGLRALATAQGLRDETLRSLLSLGRDWKERARSYAHIPNLISDTTRAIALFDQVRSRTREGNDLFFLHQAVLEFGRCTPDRALEAEHLAARLFDHFGGPPEDSFRWIETPYAGKVNLWHEVPAGSFLMGSASGESRWADEGPRQEVRIAKAFQISVVPITNAQYSLFDPAHRPNLAECTAPEDLAFRPVEGITLYQAISFCLWLAWAFPWARGARLPTEEEWEYACRAGTATRFWSGDGESSLADIAWYAMNSNAHLHRVGEKPPNAWGLFDIHGNAWEWTLNRYLGRYTERSGGLNHDPQSVHFSQGRREPGERTGQVVRGGSFWLDPPKCRAAFRRVTPPNQGAFDVGFRVVLPHGPGELPT